VSSQQSSGRRGAPAGNVRAATPRHHLDTIRLAMVDLRGHRDQLLRRAQRRATRMRADLADYREVRHQADEIDALVEEIADALRHIDQKAAAA